MFSEDRPQLILPHSQINGDQRKHIRIEHSGTVQLAGDGRSFAGRAVNISRSGMRVVAHIPDSYESVRSIIFTLPNSEQTIELPCRIVHFESTAGKGSSRSDILGLEFSFQGEAQLLLIESYIREMKKEQLDAAGDHPDLRQVPRTPCRITNVETSRNDIRIFSIDNISADGMLISFTGNLWPQEELRFDFSIPNDSKSVSLTGRVRYVIENKFQRKSIAGIRLVDSGHINEARIRNFVIACHSTYAFKNLCDHLMHGSLDEEFQIEDRCEILNILRELCIRRVALNVLTTKNMRIHELRIETLNGESGFFELKSPSSLDSSSFAERTTTYFGFLLNGGSYFFKTSLVERNPGGIVFEIPGTIYRSEKRSYQRKYIEFSSHVDLWISDGSSHSTPVGGRLIDISRTGFLCQISVPTEDRAVIRPGYTVKYQLDGSLDLGEQGEIRHLKEISSDIRTTVLLLGVEAGIKRCRFGFRKVAPSQRRDADEQQDGDQRGSRFRARSIPVRYHNSRGQGISGLINTNGLRKKTPVVIIPPAFGKKKEALSPFVTTLLYNFELREKNITVLRYDGINRPGESYNEHPTSRRGYEMLHYQVSQGLDDLQASLDFAFHNQYFEPTDVILLTFSMSSIDARKFLSSCGDNEHRVSLWISCMGVACAETTIGNILAGVDIISNHKMGIPSGLHGMLGHILDMDRIAKDLIEKKYAYMTDARRDMARIGIPVLWIYGQHDKWVGPEEVRDIMSVEADAPREVLELPAGHNLRTSDDAVFTFRLITERIYSALHDESIESLDPPKREILRLISYERERLETAETFANADYWRDYLIGNNRDSSGYDFYRNLKDFRQFLEREVQLLKIQNGNRIADMGCGTGLLLEALLEEYTLNGHGHFKLDIEAIELVPEALDRTREKCEALLLANPERENVNIRYRLTDLEPNRLIPVDHFLADPRLDLQFLRDKISGLRNTDIDRLAGIGSSELYRVLRGAALTESRADFIERIKDRELRKRVVEFNRAARFVRKDLVADDFIQGADSRGAGQGQEIDYQSLKSSALRFETLDFGDSGLDFDIPIPAESFDRIIASLLLSYLFNGEYLLSECYRALKPGGLLLVSSMKPDSDLSTIFTEYIHEVETSAKRSFQYGEMHTSLTQARSMLNEAANLFELEEDGYFHFYSADELAELFEKYGFENVTTDLSLGRPSQAVIITGTKPLIE
ncbi:MAG: PilZ domain-containing protein [Spirochaetales bacterium]|nr:PilZ domain-containing protein [Spirochaetales bacterium]